MKCFKGFAILLLLVTTMVFVACGGDSPEANSTSTSAPSTKIKTSNDMVDKEHNSKYICPMYCEGSGSEHAGDCPVCHMHYVENEDYKGVK